MKQIIHKLRQKSQPEKERIAFIGASIITFIIALSWFAGVSVFNKSVEDTQLANVSSPFDDLKNQIKIILKDFKQN